MRRCAVDEAGQTSGPPERCARKAIQVELRPDSTTATATVGRPRPEAARIAPGMDFELVGDFTEIQTIAAGRGIRDLLRLRRLYGKGY